MLFLNTRNGKTYEWISSTESHVIIRDDSGADLRIRPEYFKKFFKGVNNESS